jgi:hypothetical protein
MNGNNHVSKKTDYAGNDFRFYSGRVSACAVWARRTYGLIIGQLYWRDYWYMDWLQVFLIGKGQKSFLPYIGDLYENLASQQRIRLTWYLFFRGSLFTASSCIEVVKDRGLHRVNPMKHEIRQEKIN